MVGIAQERFDAGPGCQPMALRLIVPRGTVERHAKGSLLPPRRALRERLREKTLDALCPIRAEEAAKRNASRRGRRRVRAVGAVRCVRYSVASVPLRR